MTEAELDALKVLEKIGYPMRKDGTVLMFGDATTGAIIEAIANAVQRGEQRGFDKRYTATEVIGQMEAENKNGYYRGLLRAAEIVDEYYGFSTVKDSYHAARAGSHKIAETIRKEIVK